MSDLDQLLREALRRSAPENADGAGVADAVRQRVAQGDAGISAAAAGPFAKASGSLLGWFGAGALAVVIGGTAGFVGWASDDAVAAHESSVVRTSVGLDCPNGTPVVNFRPGERVFAVARSTDTSHVGVRSPFDRDEIVWLRADRVMFDDGSAAGGELPVKDCREGQISTLPADALDEDGPTPTAEPTATTPSTGPGEPEPDPQPEPNQAPKITSAKVSGSPFCGSDPAFIEVLATDDHAVTEVAIKWTGEDSSDWVPMTRSGGVWRFTYHPPAGTFGEVTFTARAYDAQGRSHARYLTTNINCLI